MPCLQRFALLRHLALPGSVLPVLWPQLTPGHSLFLHSASASLTGPPGVRHNSFAAQPPDLLLRSYVYLSGFGLACTLALRLASYPVSVRRLLGFATPLPPLLSLLTAACGSLHLAVTTRDGTKCPSGIHPLELCHARHTSKPLRRFNFAGGAFFCFLSGIRPGRAGPGPRRESFRWLPQPAGTGPSASP